MQHKEKKESDAKENNVVNDNTTTRGLDWKNDALTKRTSECFVLGLEEH